MPEAEGAGPDRGGVRPAAPAPSLAPAFALRMALFYTALFMVLGIKLPYLPVWLDWRGLTKAEIAAITAAPMFLRIFAGPLIAYAIDRWGRRRLAGIVLAALSLLPIVLLGLAQGFWPILFCTLLSAMAGMGLMPLAETFAMSGVRQGGLDYGRMRLWGSLSFIAIGFVSGAAIAGQGPDAVLWLLVGASFLTLMAAMLLPGDPDAGTAARRPTLAAIARFALQPRFLLFLVAAGAVQSSHAVVYTFGVIEWQRQGLSLTWAATLWGIGVAAEVGLFAFSRPVVERLGAVGLLLAGGAAALVRWVVMAFDPPLAALLPLQALHGLTFGAAHLGALHFMSDHVPPPEAATAQALYASVTSGIGMGLATLAAGPLYAELGGRAYLAMAALAALGLVAMVPLLWGRLSRRGPLPEAKAARHPG